MRRGTRCDLAAALSPQPSPLSYNLPMRIFMQTKPLAAEAPRYYQIALHQDLLGGWTLTREWGQQGGRVSVKREVYLERDDALNAFEQARDAQIRRGYHVMFSQGMESPHAIG